MRLVLTNEDKELVKSCWNAEGKIIKMNREVYEDKLDELLDKLDFMIDMYEDFGANIKDIDEVKIYYDKLCDLLTFNSTFVSMQDLLHSFIHLSSTNYFGKVNIFEVRNFIEDLRKYFKIDDERNSYYLAKTWSKYQYKNNPKGYLFGIVRNYLNNYDVDNVDVIMKMMGSMDYFDKNYDSFKNMIKN